MLVKSQSMAGGDAGESFDTISARIEAYRLTYYGATPRITAHDIQAHFEKKHTFHPNLPVVLDFPLTPKPTTITSPDKIRMTLEGIIGIGLYNMRANPEKVTPDIIMRALRMLMEMDQKGGKGNPWWEEFTKMLEAKTIPGNSPLGKAPRPILEEEELAPLQTDATSSQ